MACIPQHARVCIIGAGVAGLSAAQKLIQAGVKDVFVLEAQDRIGGRVHTVEHGKILQFLLLLSLSLLLWIVAGSCASHTLGYYQLLTLSCQDNVISYHGRQPLTLG